MDLEQFPSRNHDSELEALTIDVVKFVYSLILKAEELLFKITVKENIIISELKNKTVKEILLTIHEDQFNNIYQELVKQEKQNEIFAIFKKMQQHKNHSMLCLINLITEITIIVHTSIKRKNLNSNSIDLHIESIWKEFNIIINDFNVPAYFMHDCVKSKHSYSLTNNIKPTFKQFTFSMKEIDVLNANDFNNVIDQIDKVN
jgi:hypothetical protein